MKNYIRSVMSLALILTLSITNVPLALAQPPPAPPQTKLKMLHGHDAINIYPVTAILANGGDNDSTSGGRSFGGYGTVHLDGNTKNCLIVDAENWITGMGIPRGCFVAWMFIMPQDLSNSTTVLTSGYGASNASGTIRTNPAITPAMTAAIKAALPQYNLSIVAANSPTTGSYSNTFTGLVPTGTVAADMTAAITSAATAAGLTVVHANVTLSPHASGLIQYATAGPTNHYERGSMPNAYGSQPSGNPLGTVGSDWYNSNRYQDRTSAGDLLLGPYYLIWNNVANTLDVYCDNTSWYGGAELVQSIPTPVGWQGDLAWMDNTGQAPNSSDGWNYRIYTSAALVVDTAQPTGTITPSNSRLLPSQPGTLNWNVLNGGN